MKTIKLLLPLLIVFLANISCDKNLQAEVDAANAQIRYFSVVNDELYWYHTSTNNLEIIFLLNGETFGVDASALSPEPSPVIDEYYIKVEDWINGKNTSIGCSFKVIEGAYGNGQTEKSYSGVILDSQLPGKNNKNIFRIVRNESRKTASSWKLLLNEQNIELTEEGGNPIGGNGSGLEGVWYNVACGDAHGVVWTFSDGRGSFSNIDCNNICGPMIFTFSYTISDGNTCNLIYDAVQPIVSCVGYEDSRPPKPNDASFTFSSDGSSLFVTSGSGTTTFTNQ